MSAPLSDSHVDAEDPPQGPYRRCVLPVSGMNDATAAHRVRNHLRRMDGVVAVEVAIGLESVTLTLDPDRAPLPEVVRELADLDVAVVDALVALSIRGMTSSACVVRVRHALEVIDGVIEAQVNPVLNRADVRVVAPTRNIDALMLAVRRVGYGVTPLGEHGAVADVESARSYGSGAGANRVESLILGIVGVLTIPLLTNLAWKVLIGTPLFGTAWAFLLSSAVLALGGARYLFGAWNALLNRDTTMDLLVVLGSASAYLYSLVAWVAVAPMGRNLYFETAATIIAFVRLGKWLEAVVKHGTTRAIRSLMELRAQSARVIRDGSLVSKPIDSVLIGDVVMIKPYERIPVDGIIVRGESTVDAAMITGAGLPEDKTVGDAVTGGTMNGGGVLHVKATCLAAHSTLARIISLVEEAQARKIPLQRFVDHVTTLFVPAVLGIAGFTLFAWLALDGSFSEAITASVSVLVIACPCALGLAAPTALVAGTGAAARAGILIRDIDSLERAYRIDTVLFDKTGTLTEGKPFVTNVEALDGDVSRLLYLAASAQQGNEHPLGRAILDYADNYGIVPAALKSFEAIPGRGVRAVIEGHTSILIGNRPLMDSHEIAMEVGDWLVPMLAMK
ncbi:MAG: heavy metal translocating P-type ATPase, partial [Rhodospirillaceae bacterium]|nr:heavy metal translocating P-type ATPase [Rhodospirillaceae bacterium]